MGRAGALFFASVAAIFLVGCGSSSHAVTGGTNAGSSGGNGGTGNPTPAITVAVSPSFASVVVNNQLTFQATVSGSTNTAVTWQVGGITGGNATLGTINAAGVYTAPAQPPTPATVAITAVAQANGMSSSSASVRVVVAQPNQQAESIPIQLGVSGGNANDSSLQGKLIYCCGGTLGSLLQRNGSFYILSNNHVLARSDSAQLGDAIIQPALTDANCSSTGTTTVGNLSQFPNLQSAGTNVDAAIAQVVSGTVDTSGNILSLGGTATSGSPDAGPPHAGNGIVATVGESVAKSGRTTGLTCSTVDAIDVITSVSYQTGCSSGSTFSVTYSGQVSVSGGAFSASGDSGSLIVDQTSADPMALLYGGSDTDTVGNPVADVLDALEDPQAHRPTFVGSASPHAVAGCTIAASNVKTAAVVPAISDTKIAQAQRARDIHAPELLSNPYIQAIGVGPSIDHPGEPAVFIVVNPGQIPTAVPDELEGIATRIVQAPSAGPHGVFEMETAQRIAPVQDTFAVQTISSQELIRAKAVHSAHANALIKQPGVQGVGVTSSADAPGQAALMIFVIRGVPRNPIPVTIDGLRTRVRESSRFTAGQRGAQVSNACQIPPATASALAEKPQDRTVTSVTPR
jgi:hypothetical protein